MFFHNLVRMILRFSSRGNLFLLLLLDELTQRFPTFFFEKIFFVAFLFVISQNLFLMLQKHKRGNAVPRLGTDGLVDVFFVAGGLLAVSRLYYKFFNFSKILDQIYLNICFLNAIKNNGKILK